MSPAERALLSGAVDLSGLSKPVEEDLPEGAWRCHVEEGCNMVVRGDREHEDWRDCLATTVPYIQRYMEMEYAGAEILEEDALLRKQNKSLLMSNVMLADKIEEVVGKLRTAEQTIRQMQDAAVNVPE